MVEKESISSSSSLKARGFVRGELTGEDSAETRPGERGEEETPREERRIGVGVEEVAHKEPESERRGPEGRDDVRGLREG